MSNFIENIFVNAFNRLTQGGKPGLTGGLPLGSLVFDERVTKNPYFLPTAQRAQHMAILGKTGSGKSYFIRHMAQHEVDAGRGFVLFDLHGDLIPPILRYIAAKRPADHARVVVIDPANPQWAVGLNPLEAHDDYSRFREVADVTRSLADRWDFRGARTEELLRNALFVLSANGLTLLETALLLSNDGYREELMKKVSNQEVREYFELRFDPLSAQMKATMREPVLNKLTEFTADPHFRYVLGQRVSTFSFDEALARALIILVDLRKGPLGIHSPTFGSLILAKVKAAIFRRQRRELYTVFADEMQNLAASNTDFETLFSEARKFSVGIVTANQFESQLPPSLRSAIQAIATHVYFELSPEDAAHVAQELGGGKPVAERLRNLRPRHAIVKSGHHRPQEIVTPEVETVTTPAESFLDQSNQLYARLRTDIDADIRTRRPKPDSLKEVIHDWE
jgi:DNA helicase HerA-like ATPase